MLHITSASANVSMSAPFPVPNQTQSERIFTSSLEIILTVPGSAAHNIVRVCTPYTLASYGDEKSALNTSMS